MKKYLVIFSPMALEQMATLGEYIADHAGKKIAARYLSGLEKECRNLKTFPIRGRVLDDLRPNLRVIGHKRRTNIIFSVYPDKVIIQGVFHGGQDIDSP